MGVAQGADGYVDFKGLPEGCAVDTQADVEPAGAPYQHGVGALGNIHGAGDTSLSFKGVSRSSSGRGRGTGVSGGKSLSTEAFK